MSRKRGFSRKSRSKISGKIYSVGKKIDKQFSVKIKICEYKMVQKLIFIMNFSVLDFFKFAFRMPQIAQILVTNFKIFGGEGGGARGGGGRGGQAPRPLLSTDPITPGAWQGSHWSANLYVTSMIRPRKIPAQVGFEFRIFRVRGGRLNH